MRIFLCLSAALVLLSWTVRAANAECLERLEIHGNAQIAQQWFPGSGNCFLSVDPAYTKDLVYRSFLFSNRGIFMVFNSYGEGPAKEFTGAREFYLFPRGGMPEFSIPSEGRLRIRSSAGTVFEFDTQSGAPISIHDGRITQDPEVNRRNYGGVEIPSYPGLLLDLGFRMGAAPKADPQGKAVFRDAQGELCLLMNSDLYDFAQHPDDPAFRFPTDAGLADFLKNRCPQLNVTSLGE